jgi:hypothetical protein
MNMVQYQYMQNNYHQKLKDHLNLVHLTLAEHELSQDMLKVYSPYLQFVQFLIERIRSWAIG